MRPNLMLFIFPSIEVWSVTFLTVNATPQQKAEKLGGSNSVSREKRTSLLIHQHHDLCLLFCTDCITILAVRLFMDHGIRT